METASASSPPPPSALPPLPPPVPLAYATPPLSPALGFMEPYASANTYARLATFVLSAGVVANVAVIVGAAFEVNLLQDVLAGTELADDEWYALQTWRRGIDWVSIGAALAALAMVIVWLRRAYRNLPALGARGLPWSPGWAIGAWFVPILNLFRPYQIVRETWVRSDPAVGPLEQPRAPAMLGWWWGMWLAGGPIARVAQQMAVQAETAESYLAAAAFEVVACFVNIGAMVLLIRIIRGIDAAQADKHRLLGARRAGPVPAFVTMPVPVDEL